MTMPANTPCPETIRERLAPLFNEKRLRLVLLFGSVATKKANKHSDIDLGFLFDEPSNILDLTNRVINLLQTDNVDVVDLRRASPLLMAASVKHGKLLYERSPGVFHEFCSLAVRRFVDTKKLRDAQGKGIDRFLLERGLR
ncbi:MAG: nucleotidyltransferase domain-containing protein [Deltaproteobacteria bacterium]